jgi:hypothetical protein
VETTSASYFIKFKKNVLKWKRYAFKSTLSPSRVELLHPFKGFSPHVLEITGAT